MRNEKKIERAVKGSILNSYLMAILGALIHIGCSSVDDKDEQLFIYVDQDFKYVSDVSLLNDIVCLIIDDSLLYYTANGEQAIFIRSYPNMKFIGRDKDYLTLDSALYKISERGNDVAIELVGGEAAVDSVANQTKYGGKNVDYNVVDCCYGEWGGTVSYISKLDTSNVYSVESTCLLKVLYSNDYHYLINYLAHGFGSSSIYQIRSIPALLNSPICNQFGFDTDNWTYQDSIMQAIIDGGKNSLLLDTMGIEIVDARIVDDELYVSTKNNSTHALALSTIVNNHLKNIYIDTLMPNQNHISNDSYISRTGEVVSLSKFWDYEEVKMGIGYANEVKIYNIYTGSLTKARVISQSPNTAPSVNRGW